MDRERVKQVLHTEIWRTQQALHKAADMEDGEALSQSSGAMKALRNISRSLLGPEKAQALFNEVGSWTDVHSC